jgi:hypothetical protein
VPAFQATGSSKPSEDSLPQPPYIVFDAAPIHGVPIEDLALRSVHLTVSNLPIGSGICNQLLLTGSPDPRQLPFGPGNRPYPTSYAATIRRRGRYTGSRFPVAFRPSAFASWVLLRPLGSCAFLAVGLPAVDPPDPNGVVMLRMNKIRPGRAPPYPEDGGALPADDYPPAGTRRFPAASPYGPADTSHRRGSPSRGVIGGSLTFAHHPEMAGGHPGAGKRKPLPAGLLLARDHRMKRRPLRLLPRASHPAVTRRARRGGDRPFAHWPGYYTFAISRTSNRCLPLHSCTLMSHTAIGGQQPAHVSAGEPQPVGETVYRGRRAAAQIVRDPAQPRQRAELDGRAQSVLDTDVRAEPAKVVAGQREERDQVVVGDIVRPAAEPRELSVGQEPNRHDARYPRRSMLDKTDGVRRR